VRILDDVVDPEFGEGRVMKCRICGCTDERACPAGCEWVPGEGNLCNQCAWMMDRLEEYAQDAASVSNASLIRLWNEVQVSMGLKKAPPKKPGGIYKRKKSQVPMYRSGGRR
jgi:hypothetical protein